MISDKEFAAKKKEMEAMHTSLVVKKAKMEELEKKLAELKREIIRAELLSDNTNFDDEAEKLLSRFETEMQSKYEELKKAIGN